jgi:hypothetical protein
MTNNENDNFVTIYLEGLMICCINPQKQRFEAALLRQSNHDFTLRIAKYKTGEKIEDHTYLNMDLADVSLEIEGIGSPKYEGVKTLTAQSFNRQNESLNDEQDIRWFVDLEGEEFHNNKLHPTGESLSKHDMPLTPVFIKNAELSVGGITNYTYDKVEIDSAGKIINTEFFGKCGFILAAAINADLVSIKAQGPVLPFNELHQKDGFTYKIFITNLREDGDDSSELPVYYKVLQSASGRKFNLEKTPAEVEAYFGKTNCAKVFLSKTESIENLT